MTAWRARGRLMATDDSGVVAVLVAILTVVLFGIAALAVDISSLSNEKQKLHDTLDAAAHAGAYALPDATAAQAAAAASVAHNQPGIVPVYAFYCVVASTSSSGTYVVNANQIPATCNPGPGPYTVANYPGLRCNSSICAVPCVPAQGHTCNTMAARADKPVRFALAPAIGISKGDTGSLLSVACKGSCGSTPANPMDVAVIGDRTGSMSTTDRNSMVSGIESMLQVMTPSQQYVAMGTIGRSSSSAPISCLSTPSSSGTVGPWIPVPFMNDYLLSGSTNLNPNSHLVQALGCLSSSSTGTNLASPLKAGARFLLGYDPNNLGSLPNQGGAVTKAIIFETDGQPNEANISGSTDLTAPGDIGNSDGNTACQNFKTVATQAKAKGILIVTVGYNLAGTNCGSGSSSSVLSVLAAVASPRADGTPSVADNDCSTAAKRAQENQDGDFFFCAASGDSFAPIFATAFGTISGAVRLIKLP